MEVRVVAGREEWDGIVLGFPGADLRQSHAWGEVRSRQGWRALRVAAFAGGRCVAAAAVVARRLPGLGVAAYVPRGPLMDVDDPDAWEALPALAGAVRRGTGAAFLRISPAVPDGRDDVAARLRAAGFRALDDFWSLWNSPRNVMRLGLEGSERDLLAHMARKRRQHIATAPRRGIVAAPAVVDRGALDGFHAMLVDHAARHRYPVRDRDYFEGLREAFGAGDLALILGRVGGEVAAAVLAVRFGSTAYALHAPSTPRARGTAVGDVVHWELMRWALAAGCRTLDFGSSGTHVPPRPTDRNLGIHRFKEELGCRLVLWAPYHDLVFEPVRYRLVRGLERWALSRARFWFARLPGPARALLARRAA